MDFNELSRRLADMSLPTLTAEEYAKFQAERANSLPGNLKDGVDCPLCLNRGYTTRTDDALRPVVVPCKCMKERAARASAEKSGLHGVFDRYTMEGFNTVYPWQKSLKSAAESFLANPEGRWFYAGGTPGSGKTHICTAICGELIRRGFSVRYFVWPSRIRHLKSMANDPGYDSVFNDFANADVLYIDDLFKARALTDLTASDILRTFELINRRDMDMKRITLFSSEWSIRDILRIDRATGSRIVARASGFIFDLGNDISKNMRLKDVKL